jgi:hypothetical protein
MTPNRTPEPMRVHLGWIASVDTEPAGDVRFTLDDGTVCIADHDAGWFDHWSRLIEVSREHGWPVYVGRERASDHVRLMLHANVHQVQAVHTDPQDAGRLRIRLSGSNAIHFLRTATPTGQAMAARLHEAAATAQAVVITEDPLGAEIIDVRAAPTSSADASACRS